MLIAVHDVIEAARVGQGASHFIVGAAGFGKTTALDEATALGSGSGLRVVTARGAIMEQAHPLALVHQLVAALAGDHEVAGRLPALEGNPGDAAERLVRLFQRLSPDPTMIAIDDLHWADAESLGVLSYLGRRLGARHLALVCTLRPWPAAAAGVAFDLVRGGHATLGRLEPLSEAAAAALIRKRMGPDVGAGTVTHLWEQAAGNPMLIAEAADHLNSTGNEGQELVELSPSFFENSVHSLLAGLPPEVMRCAQAASVLQQPFRSELVVEVSRLDEAEGDAALDALCSSGVLHEAPGRSLQFAQPLVRRALYRGISPPMRTRLHARTFTALARRGFEGLAVEHAVKGDLSGDSEAISLLAKVAGKALHDGAAKFAAEHFRAAVDLAGDHAGFGLRLSLGQALLRAGRPVAAGSVLQNLLHSGEPAPDSAARVAVLRALANACHGSGRRASALAHLAEAAALSQRAWPTTSADILCDQAVVSWQMHGIPDARALIAKAREITTSAGEAAPPHLEAVDAYLRLLAGDAAAFPELEKAAIASVEVPRNKPDALTPPLEVRALYARAATAVGRIADADRFLETVLVMARHSGSEHAAATLTMLRIDTLTRLGRIEEAATIASAGVLATDSAPGAHARVLAVAAQAFLHRGRMEESLEACERVVKLVRGGQEPVALLWVGHVRGQHHLFAGDAGQAAVEYREVEKQARRIGLDEPCIVPWAAHALLAHVESGDLDTAGRVIAWLDHVGPPLPCAGPRMAAVLGRALISAQGGDNPRAEEQFRTALMLAEAGGLGLARLLVLWRYGSFLRRLGRRVDSRAPLAEGLRAAESMGAELLARNLAGELGVAGGRRSRKGSQGDALTPQEQRIADLAATGRTNREIAAALSLSVNTIETHLQRAFAKLGIRARMQLVTMRSPEDGANTA